MNNNYNNFNNQQFNGMNYNQMPNQNMQYNNMNYGYPGQKPPFKIPPIAKDLASILGYIGAIVMMLGSFMNFATYKVILNDTELVSMSINYFSTNGRIKDGLFVFLFGIVALLLVHFRKNLLSLIPTVLAALLLIVDFVDLNSKLAEFKSQYVTSSYFTYDVKVSYGLAIFLVAIGIILLIVHFILYYMNKNKQNNPSNLSMNYNQGPQPMMQNVNYNQPMSSAVPNQNNQQVINNQFEQNNQIPNNNINNIM